jgi:hypothetical protein
MEHDIFTGFAWVYHQMWRPDLRPGISPNFQVCVFACECVGVG